MSEKGSGYFGPLSTGGKDVMTEFSTGADASEVPESLRKAPLTLPGHDYVDIPSLVPTLTREEIQQVLNGDITDEIQRKAIEHAKYRASMGKSPFAGAAEPIHKYPDKP